MGHTGFETTTYFGRQTHYSSYCHPTLSEVIDAVIGDRKDVRMIEIKPKSRPFQEEEIVTEQGIKIRLGKNGVQVGPI